MNIPVTQDIKDVFSQILAENRTEEEWAAIESDDMFQTNGLVGGFDATERAFCFSSFDQAGSELWFQVTLGEVKDILAGRRTQIDARPADK